MSVSDACTAYINISTATLVFVVGIFPILSITIMVVLSYFQWRKRQTEGCCTYRMGLPVPLNFLISPHHRWPYILLFALLANDLVKIYFGRLSSVTDIFIVNILYKVVLLPIIIVVFLCLLYAPLYLCVEAPSPLLGHYLGLGYSLLWMVFNIVILSAQYYANICSGLPQAAQIALYAFDVLPVLCITLYIVLWYAYQTITNTIRKFSKNPDLLSVEAVFSDLSGAKEYQLHHVQKLLSRPPSPKIRGKLAVMLLNVFHYFIPYSKYRKLPVNFVGIVAAMVMFQYQVSLVLLVYVYSILHGVVTFYQQVVIPVIPKNCSSSCINITSGVVTALPAIYVFSLFASILLSASLLLHMVSSVSKIMKSVARHGFTEKLPYRLAIVPFSWKYIGLQCGFFVVGCLVHQALTYVVFIVVWGFIQGLKYSTKSTIGVLLTLCLPPLWYKGVFYLQFIVCKYLFYEKSEGKFLSLTNHRLFNWFALVLSMYNWFAGFVGAIFRVLFSVGITVLFIFRLDKFALVTGFEFLDFGHKAFLGFLYMDYCYNNAVVHTFIHILRGRSGMRGVVKCTDQHRREEYKSNTFISDKSYTTKKRRCLNRWLVAYTLLRNPSLQPYTAANLMQNKKEDSNMEEIEQSAPVTTAVTGPFLSFSSSDQNLLASFEDSD